MTKRKKILCFTGGGVLTLAAVAGAVYGIWSYRTFYAPGWHEAGGNRFYVDESTKERATGFYTPPGEETRYFFDQYGFLEHGWVTVDEVAYYCNPEGVVLVGEQQIDGTTYLLDAQTGALYKGWHNDTFYNDYGFPCQGWITVSDKTYYLDDSGAYRKGEQLIDGKTYYFDENGVMQTGFAELPRGICGFGADGVLLTGMQVVDGYQYYFKPDGTKNTGICKFNGDRYFFNSDGIMLSGWQTDAGQRYYFGEDGKMAEGFTKIGADTYYFDETGAFAAGLSEIDGKHYLFSDEGVLQTGWMTLEEKKSYADETGVLAEGFSEIDGKHYYFDKAFAMCTGVQSIGGGSYLFDADGVMQTGWQERPDGRHYYAADGKMATGYTKLSDGRYYFTSVGVLLTGFQTVNGSTCYFGKDGKIVAGTYTYQGAACYFDTDGRLASGWLTFDGKKYYYQNGQKLTGEHTIGGTKYQLSWDGVLRTGWLAVEGGKVCKNACGYNLTGWQTLGGKLYHFNETTGILSVSTTLGRYSIDADGVATKAPVTAATLPQEADDIIKQCGGTAYQLYLFVGNTISYRHLEQDTLANMCVYALNEHKGACYHYSGLLYYLLTRAGYEAKMIYGTGHYDSLHYWNMVKIDGVWYHLDACNGYFLVKDDYLHSKNYTWNAANYPASK